MAREIPFTPPSVAVPVKAVERTFSLRVEINPDGTGQIKALREVVTLTADGQVVSREPAPTIFRNLEDVSKEAEVAALMDGISKKIDEWATEDEAPKVPATPGEPESVPANPAQN